MSRTFHRRPTKADSRRNAQLALDSCAQAYYEGRTGPDNLRLAISMARRNGVSSHLVERASGLLPPSPKERS